MVCPSPPGLPGILVMTPASLHPFLVSHGLFCLDLDQDMYEKGGGFFSCKEELRVCLEIREMYSKCYGLYVLHGALSGVWIHSCVYVWVLFVYVQNGDCGCCVYT